MKKFERGQIWLVNFDPSFGHEYRKVRPAIIIEDNKFIASNKLIAVVPISSQLSSKLPLDLFLEKDQKNRLMKDSLIKIMQVSSFDKRRFIKHIGNVGSGSMNNVDKNLRKFLGL